MEGSKEKISVISMKDNDSYKYMKVKKSFHAKESIEIQFYIHNFYKGKKENQKFRRILKLTDGEAHCKVKT